MLLEAVTERISVFQKIDEKTEKLYENLKLLKNFFAGKEQCRSYGTVCCFQKKSTRCENLFRASDSRRSCQGRGTDQNSGRVFFQLKELHISDVAEGIEQIGERFGNVCRLRNEKLEETKKMLEQAFSFLEDVLWGRAGIAVV